VKVAALVILTLSACGGNGWETGPGVDASGPDAGDVLPAADSAARERARPVDAGSDAKDAPAEVCVPVCTWPPFGAPGGPTCLGC
jgi:hypothetical protein